MMPAIQLAFREATMSEAQKIMPDDAGTEVRLSVRALLAIMTWVAISVAVVGWFVRQFPADARLRVSLYWGLFAAILVATCLYHARKRYVAEKSAGRVLYQLAPHSYFLPRAPRIAATIGGLLLVLFGVVLWGVNSFVVAGDNWSDGIANIVLQSFWWGSPAAIGITYLWWHRRIRICENGLIVRDQFRPWSKIKRKYWDACNRDVIVIGGAAMRVPPEYRTEIDALLHDRVSLESDQHVALAEPARRQVSV
jgi:hypothetical protein